ncbi:hypothetical protein EA438_05840 [Streptococcus dysgalactiae subsp. dysgalactiae]|nr:hypothetical protein [Streptococcus dysgalactiae subsp. dysgalactiae]
MFLVACSNASTVKKDNLDGKYHFISYDDKLTKTTDIKIEDNTLIKYNSDSKHVYSIDMEKHTLSGDGSIYSYTFEDGKLTTDISGNSMEYYQEGSKAYKEIKSKE